MKRLGPLFLLLFVSCVVVANYAVSHWGAAPTFPGGPHTVTILGLTAPSAVLVVGVSFTMRDLAQQALGKWWVFAGIIIGAALSAILASAGLAIASMVGFAASELLDLGVYSPLAEREHWMSALVASNTVGSAIDSLLFLWIAFGWSSLDLFFWPQFWLKLLMTVPAVLILAPWRLRAVLARNTHGQLAP